MRILLNMQNRQLNRLKPIRLSTVHIYHSIIAIAELLFDIDTGRLIFLF